MSSPTAALTSTRDAFGIVPLYYQLQSTSVGRSLHDFSPGLPDLESLVEYLAFGELWRVDRTFLSDVRRVPPGATLERNRIVPARRAADSPFANDPAHELVRRFWTLFCDAVRRSSGDAREFVISLSGGLDSAAMAAAAVELFGTERVRAVTLGFERDFDDPEPRLARETARFLGIRWEFVNADSTSLHVDWPHTPIWPTEPTTGSRAAWDQLMPGDAGVILWGLGGDSLLRGDHDHYQRRIHRGQWREALDDVWQTVVLRGRRPGFGLQRRLRGKPSNPERPGWLRGDAPGFEQAARLRTTLPRSWRRGVDELLAPVWSYYFETEAAVNTRRPQHYVYPFFDEALASFTATLPTAPWLIDKEILRAALRGRIPEAVRVRPKTPVVGESKVTLSEEGAAACRSAIASGAADGLIDPGFALDALVPGVHPWHKMAPVMRCCATARWLGRLTASGQTDSKSGGGR